MKYLNKSAFLIYFTLLLVIICLVMHSRSNLLWRVCAKDSHCLAVEGICGEWAPSNAHSSANAIKYFAKQNEVFDCPSLAKRKPQAICTFGICSLKK